MLIKKAPDIRSSEITPKSVYLRRREFIRRRPPPSWPPDSARLPTTRAPRGGLPKLPNVKKSPLSTTEAPSAYEHITSYNNFYEFAPGAGDGPKKNSTKFKATPWTIEVDGLCNKPGEVQPRGLHQAVHARGAHLPLPMRRGVVVRHPVGRHPAVGVHQAGRAEGKAQFVEFTTLHDVAPLPDAADRCAGVAVREGLRLDEANHPLSIMAVGLYGEVLPAQNGAPIRLMVPWKYGFKGIKSIVRMRFVEKQPRNTWQAMAPSEYGFYANVNPTVDHPRWSQAREKRLPSFIANRRTEMFNGYADQVQGLYAGMDLRKTSEPITVVKIRCLAAALIPPRRCSSRPLSAALVLGFYTNDLTANPGDYITDQTGTWTLDALRVALASRRCGASPAGTNSSSCGACSGCSRSSTPCCTCSRGSSSSTTST